MGTPKIEQIILGKLEFARLAGLSPGRVSQLIADGTIGPDVLEGSGRWAKVNVPRALLALRRYADRSPARSAAERDLVRAFMSTWWSIETELAAGDITDRARRAELAAERFAAAAPHATLAMLDALLAAAMAEAVRK